VTMISIVGLYLFLRKNELSARKMSFFGLLYILFAAGLYFIPIGSR
jgi:cation:H+ antiporter